MFDDYLFSHPFSISCVGTIGLAYIYPFLFAFGMLYHLKMHFQRRVAAWLMKYSDENNTKSAYDIIGYLEGCGTLAPSS